LGRNITAIFCRNIGLNGKFGTKSYFKIAFWSKYLAKDLNISTKNANQKFRPTFLSEKKFDSIFRSNLRSIFCRISGRKINFLFQIKFRIDGAKADTAIKILDGANLQISDKIYIAGAPSNRIKTLPGNTVFDRFVGCMKNIVYETDDRKPLAFSTWLKMKTDGEKLPRGFGVKGRVIKKAGL